MIDATDVPTSPAPAVAQDLAAFVPRLALELADDDVPSWRSIVGSMLSADISGFTALSEKLAGKGKAGAEEITQLINTCFTALIDAAYLYGGEVLKFGGDALLVVFRGDNHMRRAADAGVTMQRALHTSSAAKRANLSMTVGVADGPFDAFLVGSGYRELLITGPRATEVIRLEAAAARGETLVASAIAAQLPATSCGRVESGAVIVVGATGDPPTGPDTRAAVVADLRPYLPRAMLNQLAAFAGLGGEHRLVTMGFVMVTGVGAQLAMVSADAVAEQLGQLVDKIVEACDSFGVTVLHSDIASDGVKFLLCAGAPVNTGDTADGMLHATLRIATITSPLTIRQGVQTGRVFAGFLGSEHRKTYTLMGDPVNTAARMVGKAGDREVVAVASVVHDTRTMFVSDELEPFLVKGKSEPIVAHKVRASTARVRRDSVGARLVGRRREMEVLTHAIGELGEVVELVGSAGVGKSRLLDAAWDAADGLAVYQGSCTPYGAASPYGVFRPLLRGGLGVSADASPELVGERLVDLVTRGAPHLLPMLPLLAVPFGARVAATAEADAIDPDFRRVRIHELVVQFLDTALAGPILLIVEDAHWIDDASGELANHLVRACTGRPWSAIFARRPEGSWRITDDEHVVTLALEPLDDSAIRELAVGVSTRPLLDRDLDLISSRAQGNPLFAIELARALSEMTTELPDTVEQIIASRLDRLTPTARRLVRVASVLGNQFDEAVLESMMAADGAEVGAADALASAADAGTVTHRSGTTWAFNHALYRDTAYEGLPYTRRRHLHRLAAGIIEERSVDPAAAAPLLSLHHAAARSHERAWYYSLIAGEAAEAQHATSDAAIAYARALASGRYCVGVTSQERARIAERLGDLSYELGRFEHSARAYRLARRVNVDPIVDVGLVRKLGSVCERQGRPDRAIQWYRRASRAIPESARSRSWSLARADVNLAEAGIRARRAENERCLELARAARLDARRAGDLGVEALALERVHLALTYLRRVDVEQPGLRALDAYRQLDDSSGMARILINLGIEAYFESNWTVAGQRYLEAMEVAQRAGSVVLAATAAINSAEVLSDQGSWAQAVDLLESAMRNYAAVGYSAGIAASTMFAGVAEMRAGDLGAAAERFSEARGLLVRLGMADMLEDLDLNELELRVFTGVATIADARSLAARLGPDHLGAARVARTHALLEHAAGRGQEAATMLRAQLATVAGHERGLTLRAIIAIEPDSEDVESWSGEAEEIMRTLGVHTPQPLPIFSDN